MIEDNVCDNAVLCYFVGGGRDTIVQGNSCVGDVDTCVHIDNRGLNWQADSCTYNASWTGALVQQLSIAEAEDLVKKRRAQLDPGTLSKIEHGARACRCTKHK